MFKIGEFSKLTQVSIRMLRYYDETGLLKPAQIDPYTSYRLYAAEQIPVLNQIIFLRDLGFNVAEIALALERWDDAFISQQLENKRREIEAAIQAEQQKLAQIELAQQDIRQAKIDLNYNVTIKSIPSYPVLCLRRTMADYYAEGQLWKELVAFAQAHQVPLTGETFTIYHDLDYREQDVDIELCAQVHRLGENSGGFVYRHSEPVPLMACTMVYGPLERIAGVFQAFAAWLQEHNQYQMIGTSRQILHRGPGNEDNPAQYLTEIQIPLESK